MENDATFYTSPTSMEPLFPEDRLGKLAFLATKLISDASELKASLHPITRQVIADFFRPMNSYYSNLIEGRDTHPIDVAKALKSDYSNDKTKRDLQLEAIAHITLQEELSRELEGERSNFSPYSAEFLKSIHKRFYDHLPEDFRVVTSREGTTKEVVPGEFRTVEIEVGDHVGPFSGEIDAFMKRFESYYNSLSNAEGSQIKKVIAIAASHHRLAWIHPFLDGNGRVVRLFSDVNFKMEGLDASGLWSISRGLARDREQYYLRLANADSKRLGDYDGRGNLSNKTLVEFCDFFLSTAIDQVNFIKARLSIDSMRERIHNFVDFMMVRKKLKSEVRYILEDVFLKGKITKTDALRITNTSDKTLKIMTDDLIQRGLLSAKKEGIHMMYYPKYAIEYSPLLFPGMYPANKESDMLALL